MYKTFLNDTFTDYHYNKTIKGSTLRPAAIVMADSPEQAYEFTNNISGSWRDNSEVLEILTDSKRSLSEGDVIQDLTTFKYYVVEAFGVKELTNEEIASVTFKSYFSNPPKR